MRGWLVLGNPSEKGKVMDKITRIGVAVCVGVSRLASPNIFDDVRSALRSTFCDTVKLEALQRSGY
jgi:hypothetical protein